MAIARLSPLLVNQIAAGEVIERPASVVKELVENSLDAGATTVNVHVTEGGRQLIRVVDDGGGIDSEQLALALEPHATSKIAQPDDLAAISTLGFRGEALASIASVSRFTLTSRPSGAQAGATLTAHADQVSPVKPIGCAPGTVVEVRDLFFNTPARRKFMRTPPAEFGHINDTLSRIAMAWPQVAFKLTHGQRQVFDLPAHNQARRCVELLGRDIADALLEFDSHERGVELWGLAGRPAIARSTSRQQYVFVNGRPIRDKRIAHAIKEAYRGLIDPTRQPVVVLFVNVEPTMVDVNVHPAKAEVRFVEANTVHGQVLATIRQRLLSEDLTPQVQPGHAHQPFHGSTDDGVNGDASDQATGQGGSLILSALAAANQNLTGRPSGPIGAEASGAASSAEPGKNGTDSSMRAFVDYFRQMDPRQKGFVYEQVKADMARYESTDDRPQPGDEAALIGQNHRSPEPRSILQVHDSYVVTQDESGLVIIDQHALHERMMFEQLIGRMQRKGRLESQRLLTPATIAADSQQIERLEELGSLLEKLGIDAGPIGPNDIAVHAFPTLLFDRNVDPAAFLSDLLERAEDDQFNPTSEAALHEVLDMMACKAAIKAGQQLSETELAELLARKDQVERSSACPHGRPTTVRLTLRDLEKHFKRT
jgi:DNA mismatch repair protein MutL